MYIPKNKTILTYNGEVKKDIVEPATEYKMYEVGTLFADRRNETIIVMLNNVQTGDRFGYVLANKEYKGKFFLLEEELETLIKHGDFTVKGQ